MFPCCPAVVFEEGLPRPLRPALRDPLSDAPLAPAFETRNRTRDLVGVHKPRDSSGAGGAGS